MADELGNNRIVETNLFVPICYSLYLFCHKWKLNQMDSIQFNLVFLLKQRFSLTTYILYYFHLHTWDVQSDIGMGESVCFQSESFAHMLTHKVIPSHFCINMQMFLSAWSFAFKLYLKIVFLKYFLSIHTALGWFSLKRNILKSVCSSPEWRWDIWEGQNCLGKCSNLHHSFRCYGSG